MKTKTINFTDGSVYEGEVVLGQPNGKGVYNFANGKVYDGFWLNGLPNGEGWMLLENRQEFVGHFVNGLREGAGVVYDNETSQELFKGNWIADSFEGKVSVKDAHVKAYLQKNKEIPNHKAFMEQHVKDVLNSYVTSKCKKQNEEKSTIRYSNAIYYGDILNNVRHGYGMLVFHNGDVYIGNFSNNLRHGEGRYLWKDGSYYEGGWQNDCKHGKGTYYNSLTDEKEENEYFAGQKVEKKKETNQKNVQIAPAEVTDGYVELTDEDGKYIYKGNIVNGKYHGYGILFSSGSIYQGEFFEGEKHGEGVEYQRNNYKAYDQVWSHGKLVRESYNYDLSLG